MKYEPKRLFKIFIHRNQKKMSEILDFFFIGVKTEAKETKESIKIIQKFATTGHISKEEEQLLKDQVYDLLKIAGIGIPFVLLPGASVIIPFVIKAAKKRNINLLPSSFDPDKKNNHYHKSN